MKKRLIHILTSAAVLGLVFPAAAKASTITFTLNYSPTNPTDNAKVSGSAGYDFTLTFNLVVAPFTVTVVADDNPNLSNMPQGYTCVPIQGGTNCVLFTATPSDTNAFVGGFKTNIAWQFDTNSLYPNGAGTGLGQIRILHFNSSGVSDITIPGSYCTTCGVDPGIGGQADNFSDFIVATTPTAVPEPTTLVLLGSGVGALLMRRRRRQN